MDASDIIEALGGRAEVAGLTDRRPNAVTQWRYSGIPADCWPVIVKIAQEKHLPIDFEVLRATRRSRAKISVAA
jgi:hypothetical protein